MGRAFGLALLCMLALPTATAHATVESDDGRWFITVGHLNEPTSTWQRSGLDLIIRAAGEGGARVEHDEALNLHETMIAAIVAPDGTEMECVLEEQAGRANEHGVTNRYTCADPYILSQPGQYKARLSGDIDGSPVDGLYNISGDLPNLYAEVFPPAPDADPAELQARVAALEGRIAELEDGGAAQNGAPLPGLLAVAALGVALVLRRRGPA